MSKRHDGIYTKHGGEKLLCRNGRVDGEPALVWYKEGQDPSYILLTELMESVRKLPVMIISTKQSE